VTEPGGLRALGRSLSGSGAIVERDVLQMAKNASLGEQVVNEFNLNQFHFHLCERSEGQWAQAPAWVAETTLQSRKVFGVPLLPNEYFSGRGAAVEELARDLEHLSPPRFLALVGTAGVGKTQMAVEYAYDSRDLYNVIWWVRADQPATLLGDYVGLASQAPLAQAGVVHADQNLEDQAQAVRGWLEQNDRWLMILDNVDGIENIRELLPRGGGGAVLVTSRRDGGWAPAAQTLVLDVLTPENACALLCRRSAEDDAAAAAELARELGYLPLAIEQAGAFLSQTAGFGLSKYLARFRAKSRDLLARGQAFGYEGTIRTMWDMSLQRLRESQADAIDVLGLLAFLDPDDIPSAFLFKQLGALAEADGEEHQLDSLEVADAIAALRAYGLVKAAGDGLFVHRLTQTVVRETLEPETAQDFALMAGMTIAMVLAIDSDAAEHDRRRLIPHALAVVEHLEQDTEGAKQGSVLLDRVGRLMLQQGQFSHATTMFRRALSIDERSPDDPTTIAVARSALGEALLSQGEYAEARTQFEQAIAITGDTCEADDPIHIGVHTNLATALYSQGEMGLARAYLERAIELGERIDPDDPRLVSTYSTLGIVLQSQGELERARTALAHALELVASVLPDSEQLAIVHGNMGMVLTTLGELDAARAELTLAIETSERLAGPSHPREVPLRSNLGMVLQTQGDLPGARREFERAIELGDATLGENHPQVVLIHSNLGVVHEKQGRLDVARIEFERAIELGERVLGEDHPNLIMPHSNLGYLLHSEGDLDGARIELDRAIELGEQALGTDNPQLIQPHSNLALVLQAQGDAARALVESERAVQLAEHTLGADHLVLIQVRAAHGALLHRQGDHLAAQAELEQAIEIGERLPTASDPYSLVVARSQLSKVLRARDELERARVEAERAIAMARSVLGPEHRYFPMLLADLASVLGDQREFDAALAEQREAIALTESMLGVEHRNVIALRHGLASLLQASGDLHGARSERDRGLATAERALEPSDPTIRSYLIDLGLLDIRLGDLDQARRDFSRALELAVAASPADLQLARILYELGYVERELGEHANAREHLERALAIETDALGTSNPQTAYTVEQLGRVLWDIGDLPAARDHLERAFEAFLAAEGEQSVPLSSVLEALGGVATAIGDLPAAKRDMEWALAAGRLAGEDERAKSILDRLAPALTALPHTLSPISELVTDAKSRAEIIARQREWLYEVRRGVLQDTSVRAFVEPHLAEIIDLAIAEANARHVSAGGGPDPSDVEARLRGHFGMPVLSEEARPEEQSKSYPEAKERLRSTILSAWDAREAALGAELTRALEQFLLLQVIDTTWPPHHAALVARADQRERGDQDALATLARDSAFELNKRIWGDFLRLLQSVEVNVETPSENAANQMPRIPPSHLSSTC
jgi:tetratricopeptide (TPR) repeat protein